MIRVAVVAHFLSANLGDRYQGTGVADRVVGSVPGVALDRVNSHPFDNDNSAEMVGDATIVPFDVLNPRHVDISSYDFAIMPTGSISCDSAFVSFALQILESPRLKRLFVWGGFHDITDFQDIRDPEGSLRKIFRDSKTIFYARGWLELAVYHMLAGSGGGYLGGDPVLLNDFAPFRSITPSCETNETLVISGHVFDSLNEWKSNDLVEIMSLCRRVCCVEGPTDQKIISEFGDDRIVYANSISEYAEVAKASSIIITQRLHGLALAKALSPCLPIILWVPKREPFAHIKFRSVAESAVGLGLGIAHLREGFSVEDVRKVFDSPDSFLRRDHEVNFAHYMHLTARALREIVAQIGAQ